MAANETIDKLKNAGYITVTDDSQGIADHCQIGSGKEIESWNVVESQEDGGNNVITVTFTDGTSDTFNVKNGNTGNGIASIVETTESYEDAGTNIITVTMTDGTVSTFNIKNGSKGQPGAAQASYKNVDVLPTASASTMDEIYLTPSGTTGIYNMSYTNFDDTNYSWVDLGTTAVQLSDYATKEEVNQLGQEVVETDAFLDSVRNVQSVTETTGKYITPGGQVASSNGFAYTSIIELAPFQTIVLFARGYLINVAMISKYDGGVYTPLVISRDNQRQVYKYTNNSDNTISVVCSYSTGFARTIYLSDIISKDTFIPVETDVKTLLPLRPLAGGTYTPIVKENTGYYISSGGSILSSGGTAYTDPIMVSKGTVVNMRARGYSTVVAMISIYDPTIGRYSPVVNSVDSTLRDYTFTATKSCYLVFSYYTTSEHSISIIAKDIYSITNELDYEIKTKTDGVEIHTITPTETTGKYITSAGEINTSNGYAYTEQFYVERGKKIQVIARGYLINVAMISKVITENSSYSPKVVSVDSTVKTYEYVVEESGYYAASYSTSQPRTIKIISNSPDALSARINYNSERIDALETISANFSQGLYQGVPVVGMIGDSLMSGAGYDPNTGAVHDNIEYARWKTLERESGMTYKRFCRGGMSTFAFVTDNTYGLPVALTPGNECNLYIIGLEINDRNNYPNDLGTVDDIDLSDPDNNEDTFYGNYAKIIQKITSFNPGCKFILFTNPRTDGNWNNAIRTISGLFSNCYLVDLWNLYSTYFTTGGFFDKYKDQSAHYPAMAYKAMAKILSIAIDNCINDNYLAFRNIQYSISINH